MTVCLQRGTKALLDAILQVNRQLESKPGPQNTFIQPVMILHIFIVKQTKDTRGKFIAICIEEILVWK